MFSFKRTRAEVACACFPGNRHDGGLPSGYLANAWFTWQSVTFIGKQIVFLYHLIGPITNFKIR